MNSDPSSTHTDYEAATSPVSPFTVAIGGNIVSRGVTFNNLLSMFFTRDVKHKIQQDTYIQRARMFGTRAGYLQFFELTIPTSLYAVWNRSFLFHRLALAAIENTGRSPLWMEDSRITAAASSSIDRTTVNVESGEMSFAIFDYSEASIRKLATSNTLNSFARLSQLQVAASKAGLPDYLISFVQTLQPFGDSKIAIHDPEDISQRADSTIDKALIQRSKGFIGTPQLQRTKFPEAVHHFKVFYNASTNKARVFYKYDAEGTIRFVSNRGRKKAL